MKKIITLLVGIVAATNALATDNPISCPTVTLSGTLSTRTLYSDTTYLLTGCVVVPDNVTITFQQGVKVLGQKSSNAALVFRKGSSFISQGTSSNPVLFSSNQTIGNKAPGDWMGIVFEGKATNNNSNSITLTNRTCESVTGGGTTDADNSGTLKFMRIEYAQYGLTLVSVGNGTEMHDIEIANSSIDGLQLHGGTVDFKNAVFLNNYGYDILATEGNRSRAQFILTLRRDDAAHLPSTDVSSIVFKNNDNVGGSFAGSPLTHPIFSNVTVIGRYYNCGGVPSVDPLFANGILMTNNTAGEVYNSYIDGWKYGFYMDGNQVISHANTLSSPAPSIFFAFNSLNNNPSNNYDHSGTWPSSGGCATSMPLWLSTTPGSCGQQGIETGVSAGYSSTVCSTYSSTTPVFSLSSTSLSGADFTLDVFANNDDFFVESTNRGAFDATDWTTGGWVNWYPAGEDYCPQHRGMAPTGINNVSADKNNLTLAPNPAEGITYATFATTQAGSVQITVTNNLGQVVRTIIQNFGKGDQRVAIPVTGLSAGMYIINVTMDKENVAHRRLVIK